MALTVNDFKLVDDFMVFVDSLNMDISPETRYHLRGWFIVELETNGRVCLTDALTVVSKLAGKKDWKKSENVWIDFGV